MTLARRQKYSHGARIMIMLIGPAAMTNRREASIQLSILWLGSRCQGEQSLSSPMIELDRDIFNVPGSNQESQPNRRGGEF